MRICIDISKCVSESLGSDKYKIKSINYVASDVKLFMNNELNISLQNYRNDKTELIT